MDKIPLDFIINQNKTAFYFKLYLIISVYYFIRLIRSLDCMEDKMQIQPAQAPLANTGSEAAVRTQEVQSTAKAETPRPVDAAPKDPPPRFPYPEPNRGQTIDIEA